MPCLTAKGDLIVVTSNSLLDLFRRSLNEHVILHLPPVNATSASSVDGDSIMSVDISPDGSLLAVMTGLSKRLIIYNVSNPKATHVFTLPRSASKVRFTPDSTQVLVADKTGDALMYDLKDSIDKEEKLFGHLSLLLDILMTDNGNYIISSDRDEKIRVSHYPNTYNIKSYCLGHKEFIKHIELLPSDKNYLMSASGDGFIKIWDFLDGRLCQTIDTSEFIDDKQSLNSFVETMDKEGVEVLALPIVNISTAKFDDSSSLLAVSVLNVQKIFIFKITQHDKKFECSLHSCLPLEKFPSNFIFNEEKLFVYCDGEDNILQEYSVPRNSNESFNLLSSYNMFTGENIKISSCKEVDVNLLYKRKFDNVQEYQERKRLRLDKSGDAQM